MRNSPHEPAVHALGASRRDWFQRTGQRFAAQDSLAFFAVSPRFRTCGSVICWRLQVTNVAQERGLNVKQLRDGRPLTHPSAVLYLASVKRLWGYG